MFSGHDLATFYRYTGICEMLGFNILSDCHNDRLARHKDILFPGRLHARSSILNPADHLRGHINTAHSSVLICHDAGRCHKRLHLDALCDCSFDLRRKCCHICDSPAVQNGDFLCAKTSCGADGIHGNISASDHRYFLSAQIRVLLLSDIPQELYGRQYSFCIFPFYAELFVCARTDRDKHGIIFFPEALDRHIGSDPKSVFYFYTCL